MPDTKMVTEEIQAKMAALYPHYQALQRDGSVSMSANEAQQLLDIHKALFSQNFCTTCPPAILKALYMCFRGYEVEPKAIEIHVGQIEEERKAEFTEVLSIPTQAKKYAFSGTNKQLKHFKQAFPELKRETQLTETSTEFTKIKENGWLGWFKEV